MKQESVSKKIKVGSKLVVQRIIVVGIRHHIPCKVIAAKVPGFKVSDI